ncbi:MAG: type IV pilus secretin PilQ [Nitrospirota bacterium]
MKLITKDKKQKAKSSEQRAKGKLHYLRLILLCSMLLCSLFFALWGCASTGSVKESTRSEEIPVITGIDLQDYSVTVKVSKPFSYTMYRPEDPYKVVVELLDVNTGAFSMKIVSDKAGITEIVPSQIESPLMTRIEILLQTPTTVEPEYKNNELKIRVKEEPPKEVVKAKEEVPEIKEPEPVVPEEKPLLKATEITSISFDRSADIVKILIKGNGSMTPSVLPLDNRIVIDIPDVDMKAQLPATVVSPLKGIRSGKHDNMIRLVLDLKEKTNFDVTTIGDSLIVALSTTPSVPIAQKSEEEVEAAESMPSTEGKYLGKKISLDFQDADIVPIFRLLADISGYNIVVSPEVKGKLTMKLINVPWDQALDIILKTFSLGKTVENNIIRIAPHAALARESEEAAKAKESELKAVPLETKIFHINYADVSNIEKSIKDAKILSSRGSISIDKRTSSLAVNDVAVVFQQIENFLSTLDKATPQVLIEARLVEVSTSDVSNFGIQWGVAHAAGSKPFQGNVNLGRGAFTGKNFMVDFPSSGVGAGTGAGFAIGILDTTRTMGLDLQLSALERLEKSKIISTPRIVTTDNEKASLMQGQSIPYPKVDVQSGQISVEYKDVVILIEVTPHITPSGAVTSLIFVKKEDVIRETIIGGNPVPVTSKIEGNTKVLVQTGETIVIGGLLKKTEKENTSGVPGLMNIPILGWLFKTKGNSEETTELLIFITPRILEKTT